MHKTEVTLAHIRPYLVSIEKHNLALINVWVPTKPTLTRRQMRGTDSLILSVNSVPDILVAKL